MFGYIRPFVPDMRVKEYVFYRQLYCGLCRELKKFSRVMPFTLSYDFVFLALCTLAATGEEVTFEKCRCAARPFKKHTCALASNTLSYCARASLTLTAAKTADDVHDKKGFRRVLSSSLNRKMKKLTARAGEHPLDELTRKSMSALSDIENSFSESVYDGAEAFGALLSDFFAHPIKDSEKKAALAAIGKSVGRWIYILDAFADVREDLKSGSYNPFILSGENTSDQNTKERIFLALEHEIADTREHVTALTRGADCGISEIIENILYRGMSTVARDVIFGGKKIKDRKEKTGEGSLYNAWGEQ